jgi:pentatricopeptide repeat protein
MKTLMELNATAFEMDSFLRNELAKGIHPDVDTMNIIISAFSKAKNLSMMKKYYDDFSLYPDLQPNYTTYFAFAQYHARVGNIVEVESFISKLMELFPDMDSSTSFFNLILLTYASQNDSDTVQRMILKDMRAYSICPDVSSYEILFNALADSGQSHAILWYLKLMKADNVFDALEGGPQKSKIMWLMKRSL